MVNTSISSDYFKNEMTWKELDYILKELGNKRKDDLENTRLLMYSTFQSQSTKQLKPEDIIKFSWEVEDNIQETIENLIDKDDAIGLINKLKK